MFTKHGPEWLRQNAGREPIGHKYPDPQQSARERAFARYWRKVDGLPPHPDFEDPPRDASKEGV